MLIKEYENWERALDVLGEYEGMSWHLQRSQDSFPGHPRVMLEGARSVLGSPDVSVGGSAFVGATITECAPVIVKGALRGNSWRYELSFTLRGKGLKVEGNKEIMY
jgi:hypothetical protein